MKQQLTYKFEMIDLTAKKGELEPSIVTLNECVFTETVNLMLDEKEKLVNKGSIDWLLKIKADKNLLLENVGKPYIHKEQRFFFWISTPSDARKSTCIYVREDKLSLIRQYESVVSQNWLSENLEGTEVSINKDILRVSLQLSSAYKTSIQPKIVIIPEVEYSTTQMVRTFKGEELVEGEETINSVAFDGQGVASPELFARIKEDLEVKHDLCFAGFRIGTLACKGLLVSVDFIQYFNDLHAVIGDNDNFKKVNNAFFIKDVYGDMQEIDNNTIILPTSCTKWYKNFNSMKEIAERTNPKYAEIVNTLFITKVNKSATKLKNENKKTSYQLLSQLSLTNNEYNELTQPTYDLLAKLLNPSKSNSDIYDELTMENKEAVLQYLSVFEENEVGANLSSKLSTLLSYDYERFAKEGFVRKNLAIQIEKTVKELASGSVFIEGSHFKTLASEPLAFLYFSATRELKANLGKGEFWCNSDEKQILSARYPIAMYSEIQVMNLVENNFYSHYCKHWTKELLVFNIKDITAQLMSGADFDTDVCYTTTNQTLINAVVKPKNNIPFLPMINNSTKKVPYSLMNRERENINAFGNLIGKIALLSTSVSNVAQDLGIIVNGKHYGRLESYQIFLNGRRENEVLAQEKKDFWHWYNQQQQASFLPAGQIREIISNRFYNLEPTIAKIVEESMVAIDMPKTSVEPNLMLINEIEKNYNRPYFFHLLPESDYKKSSLDNLANSLLSFYGWVVENNLLQWTQKAKNSLVNNKSYELMNISQTVNTLPIDINKVNEIYNIIVSAYNEFNRVNKIKDKKERVLKKEWCNLTNRMVEGTTTTAEFVHSEEVRNAIRSTMYFNAEKTACNIYASYEPITIAQAVSMVLATNSYSQQKYILDFYFASIELMLNNSYEIVEIVERSSEGKKVLFNTFKTKKIKNVNYKKLTVEGSIGQKELVQFERKIVPTKSFKLGIRKTNEVSIVEYLTIKVEGSEVLVFNQDNELLGTVFVNSINAEGVNLFALNGAKLSVESYKSTAKSYNFIINKIEL